MLDTENTKVLSWLRQAPGAPQVVVSVNFTAEPQTVNLSPVTGTPLGVRFVDVARQAGLNVKTIFGGEHRNKYLLETTGCGAAFFDYDQDDWVDIFWSTAGGSRAFPKVRSRSATSSRTTATAPLPMSR
jgi:enediyne biosynthesis protein E4